MIRSGECAESPNEGWGGQDDSLGVFSAMLPAPRIGFSGRVNDFYLLLLVQNAIEAVNNEISPINLIGIGW